MPLLLLFQRTGPFLHVLFHYYNLYSFSNPYVHRLRMLRLIWEGVFTLVGKAPAFMRLFFFLSVFPFLSLFVDGFSFSLLDKKVIRLC